MQQLVQVITACVLLAGNFFFVAVEFSIASARPTMVDDMVERGVAGAASLRHGVTHIDAYLSACQLGITVCSIGLGITAEPVVAHALGAMFPQFSISGIGSALIAFILAYALVSVLHVVLGELAPKSLAIARTEAVGLKLLPPMRAFYLATKPAVDGLNWLGNLVLRPFGIPPASEAGHTPHTEDELRTLITRSEEAGVLEPEERSFAEGAFSFGDRRAREVMIPRPNVTLLSTNSSIEEAARTAVQSGHTRLPLCEPDGDLDAAIGVVHQLRLLQATLEGRAGDIRELSTPILHTSEVTLLDELLSEMRAKRQHMALLADEYGTAVGIVTLEDVLEEIVGDIRDEYDPAKERLVQPLGDAAVRVRGDAPIHAVSRELNMTIEERREATLGGYLIETLGRPPSQGETVPLDSWDASVDDIDGATVVSVTLRPVDRDTEQPEGGTGQGATRERESGPERQEGETERPER